MSTLAIEINDAGLVIADADSVLAVEPGYALAGKRGIVTGEEARRQARRQPRHVSNRYWANLSADSGSAGLPGVDSAAELAYRQLASIWDQFRARATQVALVVPGHYDTDQLGLLLGMAQECEMPVRVMVNAAAAASDRPYPGCQLLYADASLHRMSVTALDQADGVIVRDEQGVEGLGLAQLMDRWAKRVAELFVAATRFDPFHHADSEQALYDQLPEWLAAVERNGSAELTLEHAGESISITVEREQLLGAAAGFYRALLQLLTQYHDGSSLLVVQLSDRLAALSGVTTQLALLDQAHVIALDRGQAARGAMTGLAGMLDQANGEVRLVRQMGWRMPAADLSQAHRVSADAAVTRRRQPTHIVHDGVAYAVTAAGLTLGAQVADGPRRALVIGDEAAGVSRQHCELFVRDGDMRLVDLSQQGTFVNERRVIRETSLTPGDRLRIGSPGVEIHVIRLEHDDGA